jgi:hypothetical protein
MPAMAPSPAYCSWKCAANSFGLPFAHVSCVRATSDQSFDSLILAAGCAGTQSPDDQTPEVRAAVEAAAKERHRAEALG